MTVPRGPALSPADRVVPPSGFTARLTGFSAAAMAFLAVIALGFWAYRENYATQAALNEVEALQRQIVGLREALSVQRAEWAYLNRPDRLRDLATVNFDRLGLLPMEPHQFGNAADVAYPRAALPEIEFPVDTQAVIPEEEGL